MIVKNDLEITYYDEYYFNSRHTMHFRIFDTGELLVRDRKVSSFYIAYVRGEWYASNNNGQAASCKIPNTGIHLFSCAKNEYREYIADIGVEIATHKLALSKDVHNFVLFLNGTYFRMIVADGSKANGVLIMDAHASSNSCQALVMAMSYPYNIYFNDAIFRLLQTSSTTNYTHNAQICNVVGVFISSKRW